MMNKLEMIQGYAYNVLGLLEELKGEELIRILNLLEDIKMTTTLYDEDDEEDFDELVEMVQITIDEEDEENLMEDSFIIEYINYIEKVQQHLKIFEIIK